MADLELGLSVEGVEEAVRDLGKVKTAQNDVGASAERANRTATQSAAATGNALRGAAQQGQAFGQAIGGAAQRVQGAAASFAQLANAIGGSGAGSAASLVASMAGAVAQGAALGTAFGPAGTVVGAILGAVPVIASLAGAHRDAAQAIQEQREQVELLRRAMLEQRLTADIAGALADPTNAPAILGALSNDTVRDEAALAREQANAEARAMSREQQRQRELGISEDSTAIPEIRERLRLARERMSLLEQEAERRRAVAGAASDQAAAAAQVAAVESEEARGRRGAGDAARAADEQRRADEEARAAMTRDLLASATSGNGFVAGGTYSGGRVRAADPLNSQQIDMQAQYTAALETTKTAQDAMRDSLKAAADAQEELNEAAKSAQTSFGEGYVNSIDEVIEKWREAREATTRAGMGMMSTARLMERSMIAVGNNIAETIGGTMKGAFEDALGAWLDGSKSFVEAAEAMAKGVIKALTIESIVQAVTEVARAVASFASQDYAGGVAHLAAAAAWGAVGVVAGGVGAAVGAFGGGGGEKPSASADNRDLSSRSVSEREVQQTTVINLYPQWATQRERETFIVGTMNDAARNGHQLDPRLLRGASR